jgi:hypothetical protein
MRSVVSYNSSRVCDPLVLGIAKPFYRLLRAFESCGKASTTFLDQSTSIAREFVKNGPRNDESYQLLPRRAGVVVDFVLWRDKPYTRVNEKRRWHTHAFFFLRHYPVLQSAQYYRTPGRRRSELSPFNYLLLALFPNRYSSYLSAPPPSRARYTPPHAPWPFGDRDIRLVTRVDRCEPRRRLIDLVLTHDRTAKGEAQLDTPSPRTLPPPTAPLASVTHLEQIENSA